MALPDPNGSSAQSSTQGQDRAGVETLAKAAAAGVAAAYIVGLLTVSSYLYEFDISLSDPDPLRARFILTGAGVILLAGLAFACPVWATWISGTARADALLAAGLGLQTVRRPTLDISRASRIVLVVVSGALPLAVVLAVITGVGNAVLTDSDSIGTAVAVYVCGFGLGGALLLTAHHATRSASRGLQRWPAVLTFFALSAVLFVAFIAVVANQVFPQVPRQFGGGQPATVRLVFDTDARSESQALGVLPSDDGDVSQPVELLFETDKILVLRRSDGHVIEIDKALVRGSAPAGAF
jgi:hypothetical protein